jgi:hypothetical protein
MKKNRIVTRIKDTTGIAKSKNRNEDLIELRAKYQQFCKNLKFLILLLTNNHALMVAYGKLRLKVAKTINALSVDTPLFGWAGDIPAAAVGTTEGGAGARRGVPRGRDLRPPDRPCHRGRKKGVEFDESVVDNSNNLLVD